MNNSNFDGTTYDPVRDGERLGRQLDRVRDLMMDGEWRTLREIAKMVQGSEAGVSARLRDLRKDKFGGYIIKRFFMGNGIHSYQLKKPEPLQKEMFK